MYLPAHFAERRLEVLRRAIDEHPLGQLVTGDAAAAIVANDLPFLHDADPAPLDSTNHEKKDERQQRKPLVRPHLVRNECAERKPE